MRGMLRYGLLMVAALASPPAAQALPLAAGSLAGGSQRAVPAGEEAARYTAVTIAVPGDTQLRGYELAHKLAHAAKGAPVTVKRNYWQALAEAFNSVPATPADKVEVRRVGRHEALFQKVATASEVAVTIYLPAELLQPQQGKYTLALETNFQRQRNSTQEITTWPVALSLAYNNAISETRSVELKGLYKHTRINNKERPAFKDENGDVIPFADIQADTIQDSRGAAVDFAYLWTLARESRGGRVDGALIAGAGYEKDEINFLNSRVTPYGGLELRLTSEKKSDLGMSLGLTYVQNIEEFIFVDPVLDASGATVGTVERLEKNELPSVELRLTARAPLYQLDGLTLILFEGRGTWLQAIEKTGGEQGRGAVGERRAALDGGLTIQTPIGIAVRLHAHFEFLRLPGEAGERIDDFQWSTGASVMLRVVF